MKNNNENKMVTLGDLAVGTKFIAKNTNDVCVKLDKQYADWYCVEHLVKNLNSGIEYKMTEDTIIEKVVL